MFVKLKSEENYLKIIIQCGVVEMSSNVSLYTGYSRQLGGRFSVYGTQMPPKI